MGHYYSEMYPEPEHRIRRAIKKAFAFISATKAKPKPKTHRPPVVSWSEWMDALEAEHDRAKLDEVDSAYGTYAQLSRATGYREGIEFAIAAGWAPTPPGPPPRYIKESSDKPIPAPPRTPRDYVLRNLK